MSRRNTGLLKAGLSALHRSGAGRLLAPLTRGAGAILTLHHVCPSAPKDFEPNRILKVTPEFLDQVIGQVKASGFDIVTLDDVSRRLRSGECGRPFVAFTLDDGYRDNRDYALPVFKKHNVPFAIYVPTDFADGRGDLWWLALENAIRKTDQVWLVMNAVEQVFETNTVAQKYDAFHSIYWWLRGRCEVEARAHVAEICARAGYDPSGLCRELVMDWDELRDLAREPLVTIGAHTKGHWAVGKLSEARAREEISGSVARIEQELGRACRHFSFPYGCKESAGAREFAMARELGLKSAVTTRKGVVQHGQADGVWGLPRLSLNGDYQKTHYVDVLLSGAPFALWNAVEKAKSFTKRMPALRQA